MILPFVLAMVVAAAAYGLSKKSPGKTKTGALTPGAQVVWNPQTRTWERPRGGMANQYGFYNNAFAQPQTPVYLPQVVRMVQAGQNPPPQLIQAAWLEATQMGDIATASSLEQLYLQYEMGSQPQVRGEVAIGADPGEGAEGEGGEGDGEGGAESWGESMAATVTTQHHGQPNPPAQVQTPTVPYPTGWDKLCAALKYRTPDFRTDNLLGSYEHNRRRLRQLGIDEGALSTEQAQLEALNRDLDDYRNSQHCQKLLAEFTGKALDVNGQVQTITPSGVLGLLKAAGPRGAEKWLRDPSDRVDFPETTRVFTRCNGCF